MGRKSIYISGDERRDDEIQSMDLEFQGKIEVVKWLSGQGIQGWNKIF